MPITASDIKLLASERMVDDADGGGQITGVTLQDGLENNVFPDLSDTARAFGQLALRKVYPAVQPPTGTDTLLGTNLIIQDMPDDAYVSGYAFLAESALETRAEAVGRLEVSHWEPLGPGGDATFTWVGASQLLSTAFVPQVGMVVYGVQSDDSYAYPVLLTSVSLASGDTYDVTYAGTRVVSGAPTYAKLGVPSTTAPRLITTRPISGTLSIGATECAVDDLLVALVPKHIGLPAGTAPVIGIDAVPVVPEGRALGIRTGDGLVVHHTASLAADTYAATDTVDLGRTNLSAVHLADVDGLGVTTGWTADLATGIVTVTDVTGWQQPMVFSHTIEEVLACARTGYPEVAGGSTDGLSTEATTPFTLFNGIEMYVGRPNVGSIKVFSRTGQDITNYTYQDTFVLPYFPVPYFSRNLAAGTVTFNQYAHSSGPTFIANHSPVTLVFSGGYYAPSAASLPLADLATVQFNRPLTRAFPAGSKLSSMLYIGDLQARAGASFSQATWTEIWADARIGNPILPQYQQATHPIVVTDLGAINERWAIIFLSATTYRVVGQSVGQISTGDTSSALVPINPANGAPYFTLAAEGWGSGWQGGNVLRFNTRGANAAVWAARATLPSAPDDTPDSLTLAVRGNIDA